MQGAHTMVAITLFASSPSPLHNCRLHPTSAGRSPLVRPKLPQIIASLPRLLLLCLADPTSPSSPCSSSSWRLRWCCSFKHPRLAMVSAENHIHKNRSNRSNLIGLTALLLSGAVGIASRQLLQPTAPVNNASTLPGESQKYNFDPQTLGPT